MAINGVSFGNSILNQSVVNIQNQLTSLQSQITTGKKSTTYAGLGVNEGFAIAARSQLAEISGFSDTATSINTNIGVANTGLQSLVDIGTTIQNSANSSSQALNSAGQTIAQQNATSQLSTALGILNTQSGDRFLFSGSAVNTPAVASFDDIINGNAPQAGLKQVISERQQADLGTSGLGRVVISSPTPTSVQVAEDVAGSPFGLKLSAISSSLTGSTVTGPTGSPAAVSVTLGANPNNGDQVSFKFNLPDGTTQRIQLTASSATPPPTGSFAIGATPAATAANLNAALTTAVGTLANTSLVAASAIAAGNDFFNSVATAPGSSVKNQAATPAPITGATLLSGAPGSDSLATSFAAGDSITVNGTPITFVASGATGNQLNVTDSVQTLLSKIDFDHGHFDALDRERRRGHAAQRQWREPDGHEFEHNRVRGTWLSRDRDGDPAAASGQRPSVWYRDVARRWHGEYGGLVHRRSGERIRTGDSDGAYRSVDHSAIRDPRQRAGHSLADFKRSRFFLP